jgi:hypothetical protein
VEQASLFTARAPPTGSARRGPLESCWFTVWLVHLTAVVLCAALVGGLFAELLAAEVALAMAETWLIGSFLCCLFELSILAPLCALGRPADVLRAIRAYANATRTRWDVLAAIAQCRRRSWRSRPRTHPDDHLDGDATGAQSSRHRQAASAEDESRQAEASPPPLYSSPPLRACSQPPSASPRMLEASLIYSPRRWRSQPARRLPPLDGAPRMPLTPTPLFAARRPVTPDSVARADAAVDEVPWRG